MRVLLLAVGKTPLRYDENPYFFEYLIDKDDNQEIDIVTFGYNEGLDIRISPQDDFDSVINRLPDG